MKSKSWKEIRDVAFRIVKEEEEGKSDVVFSMLNDLKDRILVNKEEGSTETYGALIECVEILCVRTKTFSDPKSKKITVRKCGGTSFHDRHPYTNTNTHTNTHTALLNGFLKACVSEKGLFARNQDAVSICASRLLSLDSNFASSNPTIASSIWNRLPSMLKRLLPQNTKKLPIKATEHLVKNLNRELDAIEEKENSKKNSSRYVMFVHFYLKALKSIVQSYANDLSSSETLIQTLARCRGTVTFVRKPQDSNSSNKKKNKIEQAAEANLVAIPKLVDQIVSNFLDKDLICLSRDKEENDVTAVGKIIFLSLAIRQYHKDSTNKILQILNGLGKMSSLALRRERSCDSILSHICESIYTCWSSKKQQQQQSIEIMLLKEIAMDGEEEESPYTSFVASNVLIRMVTHHDTQRDRVLKLLETCSRRCSKGQRQNPFARLMSMILISMNNSNNENDTINGIVERSRVELENTLKSLKQKRWNEPCLKMSLRLLPSLQTGTLLRKADAISELRYTCIQALTEPDWCHAPDNNKSVVDFHARVSDTLRGTFTGKEKLRSKNLFRSLDMMMQSKCGNIMWCRAINAMLDLLRAQLFSIASKRTELVISILTSCEKSLTRLCKSCSCESCGGGSSKHCVAASHAIHLARFNAELSCHTRDQRLMNLMMMCSVRVFQLGASLAKKNGKISVLEEAMKSFRCIGETFSDEDKSSSSTVKSFLPGNDDECKQEVVRYVHRTAASSSSLPDVVISMKRRMDSLQQQRAKRRKLFKHSSPSPLPSSSPSGHNDDVNEQVSSAFRVLSGLMRGLNANKWNSLPLENRNKLRRLVSGLEKKLVVMGQ